MWLSQEKLSFFIKLSFAFLGSFFVAVKQESLMWLILQLISENWLAAKVKLTGHCCMTCMLRWQQQQAEVYLETSLGAEVYILSKSFSCLFLPI